MALLHIPLWLALVPNMNGTADTLASCGNVEPESRHPVAGVSVESLLAPKGSVELKFVINPAGNVSDVHLVSVNVGQGSRRYGETLGNNLVESIKHWRYPSRDSACAATTSINYEVGE